MPSARAFGGQFGNKVESFRDHETAGARLFDRIADGVEPYHFYARSLKLPEDRIQIGFRLRVADIDIHLLRIECGPQQFPLAREQRNGAERKRGARPINAQNIRFARALREDPVESEKHARILRSRTLPRKIEELRGRRGNVVHNKISNELDRAAQSAHVFPGSQARVHLSVIDRVKSGISAVNGSKKGQKVRSAEDSGQWSL